MKDPMGGCSEAVLVAIFYGTATVAIIMLLATMLVILFR